MYEFINLMGVKVFRRGQGNQTQKLCVVVTSVSRKEREVSTFDTRRRHNDGSSNDPASRLKYP